MTAAAILRKCRNQNMSTHANVISMLLRRGGADKITFQRLHKLGLCFSCRNSLGKQSRLSENNDNRVKKWIKVKGEELCDSVVAVNKASTTESKSPEAHTEIPLDEAMNQLETSFMDIAMSDAEIVDEIVLLEKSVQQADLIESAEDADLSDTSSPREVGNVTASYNLDDYIIIDLDSEEFLAPKVRNVCKILIVEKKRRSHYWKFKTTRRKPGKETDTTRATAF